MIFSEGIKQYVVLKHINGIEFVRGESYLTRLYKSVGEVELNQISTPLILAFLNGSIAGAATWRQKYFVLREFFDFWAARGEAHELLMPPLRPKDRRDFVPYVYSRADIAALLKATAWNRGVKVHIARPTMRTLIVLLYATGARIGEVLSLEVDDVCLERSNIRITNKNPNRCREIPIGVDLRKILRRYLAWRAKKKPSSPKVFLTKSLKPVTGRVADRNFQRLRQIATVARDAKAVYQPCLKDFQCTFAVHRITSWIRRGLNLDLMLPALAVYMGLVGLISTERYLNMVPARFEKHLNKLSPCSRKRRWGSDKRLVAFLRNL